MAEQNGGPDTKRSGVSPWQYPNDFTGREQRESPKYGYCSLWRKGYLSKPRLAFNKNGLSKLFLWTGVDSKAPTEGNVGGKRPSMPESRKQKVYDILNAGPRNRFTVSGVLVSNCTLAIMYGAGKNKLAQQLDMSVEETSELVSLFHAKVPFLRGTVDAVMRRIEHPASNGSIRTLLGRKCRFPLWEPVEWGVNKALPREQAVIEYGPRIKRAGTYKGLNRLIQGSAADQTKAAMVALHEAGFDIRLQVHDEIALSVDTLEEAKEAAELMANAVRLEVPSRCDVEIGQSWGDSMK